MNRPILQGYHQFLDLALDAGLLAQNGLVLADNVLFRSLVAKVPQVLREVQSSVRLRGIAEKLHRFNLHFLREDPRTEGLILDQDDGLAIIWRRSWCAEWHGGSLELVMRCYARKKASEQERGGAKLFVKSIWDDFGFWWALRWQTLNAFTMLLLQSCFASLLHLFLTHLVTYWLADI